MRLTEKLSEDLPIYFAKDGKDEDETNTKSIIQKLGQLEDIEQELGIDLITLFKALKQGGVYVKADFLGDTAVKMYSFQICGDESGITIWSQVRLNAKDYGKTWALTEKELL